MSTFEVPILLVDDVYDHPNADRLSILRIRGYEAIANKNPDGSHRYVKGEYVIYVPEGAVVPDQHLKERGYWNADKGVGILAGARGNRVKAITLRGVLSQGLVWKTSDVNGRIIVGFGDAGAGIFPASRKKVSLYEDVAPFFGITKYVPEVPTSMDGLMKGVFESRLDYDIENIKAFPDLFEDGEEVVVTEKLHGTLARISHVDDAAPDPELFGDGRVAISTKGMGADGLTFINVQKNLDKTLYVKVLAPLADKLQEVAQTRFPGCRVHLLGEVYGAGVQDLHYGLTTKAFAAFDVGVSDNHGTSYLDDADKMAFFAAMGVDRVPVLYKGPFDRAVIDKLASGTTTLGRKMDQQEGPNIREGVVVTAAGDQRKRTLDSGKRLRPILKHVSEAYLTRKGGTEFQ
ncbi:RNA ligase [Caulobacter phage CcrColossus]|uniref:Putative RNA ligase n=1 Tax=Caulobacter phage CcrColossus TaxID=1211640 RepID=K4K692_9CAUD|nr:RNA ligase [Caulobacter phage CcrColossus]AFU88037.1 putative RNA ligase [Caulobacter phage CcrColossus]